MSVIFSSASVLYDWPAATIDSRQVQSGFFSWILRVDHFRFPSSLKAWQHEEQKYLLWPVRRDAVVLIRIQFAIPNCMVCTETGAGGGGG